MWLFIPVGVIFNICMLKMTPLISQINTEFKAWLICYTHIKHWHVESCPCSHSKGTTIVVRVWRNDNTNNYLMMWLIHVRIAIHYVSKGAHERYTKPTVHHIKYGLHDDESVKKIYIKPNIIKCPFLFNYFLVCPFYWHGFTEIEGIDEKLHKFYMWDVIYCQYHERRFN